MKASGSGFWHAATSAATLGCLAFTCLMVPIRLIPHGTAADPHAMTVSCATASCCTARCYLDGNGVHHCVPQDGTSCECGLSTGDDSDGCAPLLEIAALSSLDPYGPIENEIGWMPFSAPAAPSRTAAVPTPPPRG